MSPLRQALAGYLAVRRSLGYQLTRPEKLLGQFITYLEDVPAETITTAHALAWATLPGGNQSWHALRLSAVRGFAAYLHTIDPSAEVPPADLIPWRPCRATPYLYSSADIAALIAAAASLRFPLRVATYQTLIGLLAVTGMRVGEAIRLDRADLDLGDGVITVRQSKFGNYAEHAVMPGPVMAPVASGVVAQDSSA
jgi:integrase/recombinase XerD